jgi:hypothetical protein
VVHGAAGRADGRRLRGGDGRVEEDGPGLAGVRSAGGQGEAAVVPVGEDGLGRLGEWWPGAEAYGQRVGEVLVADGGGACPPREPQADVEDRESFGLGFGPVPARCLLPLDGARAVAVPAGDASFFVTARADGRLVEAG